MFGANPFACIYFAEPFPAPSTASEANPPAPAGRPGKRRKRKRRDLDDFYTSWPGMIWPDNAPKLQEKSLVPAEPEVVAVSEAPSTKSVAVSPEILNRLSKRLAPRLDGSLVVMDQALKREIARIKGQIRQEMEDERILMMLGLFDD